MVKEYLIPCFLLPDLHIWCPILREGRGPMSKGQLCTWSGQSKDGLMFQYLPPFTSSFPYGLSQVQRQWSQALWGHGVLLSNLSH